jgi:CRP-like cAMP-binding protein
LVLDRPKPFPYVDNPFVSKFVSKLRPWEENSTIQGIVELRSKSQWDGALGREGSVKDTPSQLSRRVIELVLNGAIKTTLPAGELLRVKWGAQGSLYFLQTGSIKQLLVDTEGKGDRLLDFIQPGHFFALESLLELNNATPPYRFEAEATSTLLEVDVNYVNDLCLVENDVAEQLYRFLAFSLGSRPTTAELGESELSDKFLKTVAQRSQKATEILGTAASTAGHDEFKELFPEASGTLLKAAPCTLVRTKGDAASAAGQFYLTQSVAAFAPTGEKVGKSKSTAKAPPPPPPPGGGGDWGLGFLGVLLRTRRVGAARGRY